jgi:hypothetical protein
MTCGKIVCFFDGDLVEFHTFARSERSAMRSLLAVYTILIAASWAGPILPYATPLLTTAGEPGDIRYRRPPGRGYDGIGNLFIESSGGARSCTGSLLSSGRHVVTAAHCVTDGSGSLDVQFSDATFELPNGSEERITVSAYNVHPVWTGDLRRGGDLAVLTLSANASPQVPRYDIYSQSDELGQEAELVGYGAYGAGTTGYLFEGDLRRGGWNRLDSTFVNTLDRFPGWTAGPTVFLTDFDDGSAAHDAMSLYGFDDLGTGLDEVFPAPGDSGAPAFLGGRIAAVASFATRLTRADGTTPDIDSDLNRSFGEVAGLTRVSAYDEWIRETAVVVPEPCLMLPSCLGLVSFVLVRRRCSRPGLALYQNLLRSETDRLARVR